MRSLKVFGLVCGVCVAMGGSVLRADEASGKISETGFGSFQINDKGTLRQFNLARGKSQYEPATWRPLKGDDVTIIYTVKQTKRNTTVLAVEKVTLVKAGPDTITDLPSPVTATIVETGVSGVKAKLPKGQVVKFDYKRGGGTQKVPAGWVEIPGEKVIITFHAQPNRWTDNVNFVADKVEKVK